MRALPSTLCFVAACGNGGVVEVGLQPASTYVVSQLRLPRSIREAREYALDLMGNGELDNQLGIVFESLTQYGLDFQGPIDRAIAEGTIILLVRTGGFSESASLGEIGELQVLFGTNPQPPACNVGESYTCTTATPPVCTGCGHHLTGTASFDVDPSSPQDSALVGEPIDAYAFGPGALSLELVLGDQQPIVLDLIGARARLDGNPTSTIVLDGAITHDELAKLIPPAARMFAAVVQRDCCGLPTSPQPTCSYDPPPSCGCTGGSFGQTLIQLFDADHDCMVSAMEIEMNSYAMSLLAPDVTIDGQPAVSLGVQVSLVGATF